jgi:hypothetical protein
MILTIALVLAAYWTWALWSGRILMRGSPFWIHRSEDPFSYWTGVAVLTGIILVLLTATARPEP